MTLKKFTLNCSMVAILAAVSNIAAAAAGYSLIEQSGSGMGNAFAGGAASAEDASTIYYNPAGMSRLKGKQVAVALHAIRPSAKFTPGAAAAGALLQPVGNNGGDPGDWGYVPNGYFSMEIDPAMQFGVGVNVPFGLQTSYDPAWIGRFQAIQSKIQTINVNPALAYRVSDTLTVGAGLNYQTIDGTLTSAVNYSAAAFSVGGAGALAAIGGAGVEGVSTIKGKDAAWGYNFGILLDATPQTRVGLAYRSTIDYTLTGTVTFTNRPALLAAAIPDGAVSLNVKMPDTFSASAFHELSDKWDVMADATWTGWSVFKQLKIDRASGPNLITVQENWKDTWRVSVGANHHYNEQWTTRMGLAYDQTPVSDQYRTARIPDQNRIWVSFGGQYKPGKDSAIDVAYTHLFINDAPITDNQAATGKANLSGTYSSIATNILSVQYTYGF
ncbi:MAG: outer membrane protein transport protein [Gallionella sp.]|jgi:long-chain fatty acid transport protein|nr:outer membrane protein transport protein [Gallionella sp.]MCK9352858.1 outer membrane protein transport protein [Gallionella sp.]